MAEDGQEPDGGLPGTVRVSAVGQDPITDWLVQSVWLQMVRNPMVDK